MKPELGLAPGQRWRTRAGRDVAIIRIDSDFTSDDRGYPVLCRSGVDYDSEDTYVMFDGAWLIGQESPDDLIERLA